MVGYPRTRFVSPVSQPLVCKICEGVFNNPLTTACKHSFCKECIYRALALSSACPDCGVAVSDEKLEEANPVVKQLIEELQIQCDCAPSCDWVGALPELEPHLVECVHVHVSCPYGCSAKDMYARKDLTGHKIQCKFRPVACSYCHDSIAEANLAAHQQNECPAVPMECPNKCGVSVLKPDVATHIRDVCEEATIPCTFRAQGCMHTVRRASLQVHLNESMHTHTMLCSAQLQKDADEIFSLKQENMALRTEILEVKKSEQEARETLAKEMASIKGKREAFEAEMKAKAEEERKKDQAEMERAIEKIRQESEEALKAEKKKAQTLMQEELRKHVTDVDRQLANMEAAQREREKPRTCWNCKTIFSYANNPPDSCGVHTGKARFPPGCYFEGKGEPCAKCQKIKFKLFDCCGACDKCPCVFQHHACK